MISELCSLGLTNDDLSRWHDDDLSPASMTLIRTHIATCVACRERLAAFETIGAGLRALQPPPLDVERLMTGLRESSLRPTFAPSQPGTLIRMPTSTPRRSWRMVTGAASLAAVVVLSLLAGYIFTTHERPFASGADATPSDTLVIPLEYMPMGATVISMSSPTDGWAFGSKTSDSDSVVLALHYTRGRWTRVQTVIHGRINALKMLSASDGWLVGDAIYHYDGHSWQEVVVPRRDGYDQFGQITAFSPSAIWISDEGNTPAMLHYDGKTWTLQDLPTAASLHLGNYAISSISMASADEGWAVGTTYYSPTNNAANNDIGSLGVLLHYTGGVWNVDSTYPNYDLATISLASSSDGWIGGDYQTDITKAADGSSSALLRPFLWRLTDGVWKDAPVPNPHGYSSLVGKITNIQMLSTTEGWMIGGIDSATRADFPLPTLPPEDPPYYRLQNGRWVAAPMPATLPYPYNADQFAYVSPDEFWAMGGWGISHYYKGAWKNVV